MLVRHAVSAPGTLLALASMACQAPEPVAPERAAAELLTTASPAEALAVAADVLGAEGYEVVGRDLDSIRLEKLERRPWEPESRRRAVWLTMQVTARRWGDDTRIRLLPGALVGVLGSGGVTRRYPVALTRELALDAGRLAREIERALAKRGAR